MNMKSFKIIVAKLKNEMSYNQYILKYRDRINELSKSIYSDQALYYEFKDEFEDLQISLYEKIKLQDKKEVIDFMVNELNIKMNEVEKDSRYKGSNFRVEFTKNEKLVLYSYGKRTSYKINSGYDVYNACVSKEILL